MKDNKEELLDETEEIIHNDEKIIEENAEEVIDKTDSAQEEVQEESKEDELDMLRKNKDQIKKLTNEVETFKDRLLRVTAEYENFRKRTVKEKEGIYTDACSDVLKEVFPVIDNLERAFVAEGSIDDLKKGIEMTLKGVQGSLEKLGVEEIDASKEFDPNLHQAVAHIEDESVEKNTVVEVFMKGYKRWEKVIRHSVVKVAN
jgi:molecular chaperone GrpE